LTETKSYHNAKIDGEAQKRFIRWTYGLAGPALDPVKFLAMRVCRDGEAGRTKRRSWSHNSGNRRQSWHHPVL
jgi:hypothetical protein